MDTDASLMAHDASLVAHDASSNNIRVTIDNLDTQTNGDFKFNFVEWYQSFSWSTDTTFLHLLEKNMGRSSFIDLI